MRRLLRPVFAVWAVLAVGGSVAWAEDTPRAIVEKAESLRKVDNSIQTVRMTLVSKSGSERTRTFELTVRRDDDAVRSLTRFTAPADVAGTAMVVVDHPETVDEQLLYVPALRRVTRIAGKARSGAFLGSDFSFEDLEVSSADEATHKIIEDTETAWVIETVPGDGSSYSKIVTTVRKRDHLPTKVAYTDKKGRDLKVLTVEEEMVIDGATYPKVSVMTHLQRGTKTRLEVLDQKVNLDASELPDSLFSQTHLERGG